MVALEEHVLELGSKGVPRGGVSGAHNLPHFWLSPRLRGQTWPRRGRRAQGPPQKKASQTHLDVAVHQLHGVQVLHRVGDVQQQLHHGAQVDADRAAGQRAVQQALLDAVAEGAAVAVLRGGGRGAGRGGGEPLLDFRTSNCCSSGAGRSLGREQARCRQWHRGSKLNKRPPGRTSMTTTLKVGQSASGSSSGASRR